MYRVSQHYLTKEHGCLGLGENVSGLLLGGNQSNTTSSLCSFAAVYNLYYVGYWALKLRQCVFSGGAYDMIYPIYVQ